MFSQPVEFSFNELPLLSVKLHDRSQIHNAINKLPGSDSIFVCILEIFVRILDMRYQARNIDQSMRKVDARA